MLFGFRAGAQPGPESIWYFGYNAGVDFRSGQPVALTDGAIQTIEGCATISDSLGNLLFYTDGLTVWSRLHQPMPADSVLCGHTSSTQAALIVPQPGSPDRYFVFTTDAQAGIDGCGCLAYSVVDLSANGGLGAVTELNHRLHAPTTEKLAGLRVRFTNGELVWVAARDWNGDTFRVYAVTADGVLPGPVISHAGLPLPRPGGLDVQAIGQLKFSPDGRRLAMAVSDSHAEVFDFNPATGAISNATQLNEPIPGPPGGGYGPYGVEFSPDSRLLYVSSISAGDNSRLHQYDLTGSGGSLAASGVMMPGVGLALQRGPDGRIYSLAIAQDIKRLNAIPQPNVRGTGCGAALDVVPLPQPMLAYLGLPGFVQTIDRALTVPLPGTPVEEVPVVGLFPNVFTPNADDVNDTFGPTRWEGIAWGEMRIYSRWGRLLFTTADVPAGWPGEEAAAGTYYYEVSYTDVLGRTERVKGWVELVR